MKSFLTQSKSIGIMLERVVKSEEKKEVEEELVVPKLMEF